MWTENASWLAAHEARGVPRGHLLVAELKARDPDAGECGAVNGRRDVRLVAWVELDA